MNVATMGIKIKRDIAEKYISFWRRYIERKESTNKARCFAARNDAHRIAEFLTEYYGCREIYLIGSALSEEDFNAQSDIDLVVKGLPADKYFEALTKIRDLTEYEFDLIPYEDANALLKKRVAEEGILLR